MKEVIMEVLWTLGTAISIIFNLHLIKFVWEQPAPSSSPPMGISPTNRYCAVKDPTPDRNPVLHNAAIRDLDALPRFNGMLSHIVLEVEEGPEEVSRVRKLFQYWEKYPPCLLASNPTSWSFSQVTLSMLFRGTPNVEYTKEMKTLFKALPVTVKACFKSFEIRQAGLKARTSEMTLEEDRQQSRALFSAIVTNRLKMETPNHILYISPDCVPIQPNWLNTIDYRTRPPNEAYWMLGSIFRGQRQEWSKDLASFVHINRYAVYNLADKEFGEWYIKSVKKYSEEIPVPLYDFGRWEMDIFHYLADLSVSTDFQTNSAKFRFSNTILNQWNMTINIPAILSKESDVALVCGVVPEMTKALDPPPNTN